jgi:hypothetical protein
MQNGCHLGEDVVVDVVGKLVVGLECSRNLV